MTGGGPIIDTELLLVLLAILVAVIAAAGGLAYAFGRLVAPRVARALGVPIDVPVGVGLLLLLGAFAWMSASPDGDVAGALVVTLPAALLVLAGARRANRRAGGTL